MDSKEPAKTHVKPPKSDCAVCGKPYKPKIRGSLTGWIFGEESFATLKDSGKYCNCDDLDANENSSSIRIAPANPSLLAKEREKSTVKKPTLADDANVGRKIAGRYELLAVIGHGGMSTVYKVLDHVLAKTLALKMLRQEFADNESSIKRLEQEATAIRSLTHPHLATVYDYGRTEDGSPYLVMDYIEGDSLAEVLEKEAFIDVPRAVAICLQICTAVSYAHEHGVIHRDLKPSNIILTEAGGDGDFVKLIDFGIAKMQSGGGQKVTQTGEIFGSPLYMSPEQCMGYPLDARSDVYALGCVLFELVTGKPPFVGENPVQTIFKHLNETPPSLANYKSMRIPVGFEAIVAKALQKKPEDRYQTVDQLRADLKLVWLGEHPGASTARLKPFAVASWFKRRNLLYLVLAAAVGYSIFASVLLLQSHQEPQPAPKPVTAVKGLDVEDNPSGGDTLATGGATHLTPFKSTQPFRIDWQFDKHAFSDLEFDLNFRNELPRDPAIFLRLYEGSIGSAHFYFGFQSYLHNPSGGPSYGRGMIYSRWKTANLADARCPGGYTESDPATPFVGIRHVFPWTNHHYKVKLTGKDRDKTGIWYELSIKDLDTGLSQTMGALKFPKEHGQYPLIKDGGWTMMQILRGVQYEELLPLWHISINGVLVDNALSKVKMKADYGPTNATDIFVHQNGGQSILEIIMQPKPKSQHPSGALEL